MKSRILAAILAMATANNPIESKAGEIQFVEDFVLAKDRAKSIEQLIPGTDVYYFFQCVHLQNTQRYEEVNKLLVPWEQRHGETESLREIRHRQMLLTYSANPKKTLDYLIHELHPNLSHRRDQLESKPRLPSILDPKKVSYEVLKKLALRRHRGVKGFADAALDGLRASDLDATRRRELLSRLMRPTHPELVELILADLNHKGSRGFGSLGIHRQLLLSQLDDLIRQRPKLENETNFVNVYLQKLQPNPDIDWQNDATDLEAYLSRMWSFVVKLNASHNSLKAHVLYHQLTLDEKQGKYNKRRFLEYLALPRQTSYVQPRLMEDAIARRYPVDLGLNPGNVTQLPPITNDEPLVRRYFLHLFQTENNYLAYEPYVRDVYLRHLFAETKITAGLGDPEKWYSLLPPAQYQALKERVDLDFARTNPQVFKANDPIQLGLYVKNVDKLMVKVYEVNTRNYYQQYKREVNTDINLDGLIANHEATYEYDDAPVIRKRRHFEFPELQQPGVYVIDFIGNGKSSRAVVRKGQLHYVVQTQADGHIFSVFNDRLAKLNNVALWMSGQQFESDANGTILVPFSTAPGRQSFVLTHENLSSLHSFQHKGEAYEFTVAAHVDREALLDRQEAVLMLRGEIRLSGFPVSTQILEEVQVTLRSTTLDGVESEKVYDDVKLLEAKDTPLVFLVPSRLASIQVDISAKITDAKQKPRTVTASHQLTVNQIDKTDKIEDVHLTKLDDRYILQLLGKTGEPKPHRPMQLMLSHSRFSDAVRVDLATDENGTVDLGTLGDITHVVANGPNTAKKSWTLWEDRRTQTRSIHARGGETVQVPHMLGKDGLAKSEVSLYELRGGSYAKDAAESIIISDHFVELKNLEPGDYSLAFNGQRNRIRVTRGKDEAGFALGNLRRLERRKLRPVHLTSITANGNELRVQLENTSKFTRVHVYASRFFPAFDSYQAFSSIQEVEPLIMRSPAQRSYYMAGRKLGDELQYVLERSYASKYPGNMLERPTMLLNSWPMRSTETTTHAAEDGEEFDAAAPASEAMLAERAPSDLQREAGQTDFANLDFLVEPTMLIANQTPDENGRISIPLEELGPHHHFQVVAVDPLSTVYRSMSLSEVMTPMKDLRLKKGLDPEKHYTQQKTITRLPTGETFEMADITTGRFDTYDSLGGVYSLYSTLSSNDVLRQFQFIVDWPTLSTDEKKEKYSEFACHELNFFLYKKDLEFFDEIVQPYIANKQHKTFLDLWLLESDLTHFLQPWEYTQLNTAERLLLGERIDGEDARVRRLIEDLFDLIPRDVSQQNLWFETAIQGNSLEYSDKLGFVQQQRDAKKDFGFEGRFATPALATGRSAGSPESLGIRVEEEKVLGESLQRRNLARKSRMKAQSGRYDSFSDDADDAGAFRERLSESRGRRRQLYEKLEKTQEWAENNYYRLPIEAQDENLIHVNAFWQDFAQRETNEPFFSIHGPTATRNFSEMMFALSLLDLPFESTEHKTEFVDQRMTLTAGGPMIVFQEQIREAESSDKASPILITQNFFRADDRYQMVQGERRDKFVTDEFLAHVVYGSQVVLTNPTSSQRRVQLLLQVPHESLPTNGGKATQTVDLDLAPYHTQTVDYFFYFPAPGEYKHFPAHVAQGETLLAHADPTTMKVVAKPSNVDTQSWDYVSQFASNDEVMEYLNKNNVFEIDLERIAFRMAQKAFFTKAIELLEKRHAYAPALWAYGFKHNTPAAIATYLKQNDQFLSRCGEALDSDLVDIDPVIRRTYQHLDYKPLVNARAHRLGGRRRILNNRLDQQYHELLEVLKYRRELNNQDRIAMTYYLLLQDRVEEAIEMFSAVERSNLDTQIQYDYFAAYLDCFRDEPSQARAIVTQYVNYPVPKWKKAFANVKSMLDEIDGNDLLVIDPKDRTQTQTAAAAEQVNFDFIVEDKQIRVDYQNVDNIQVNYYLIDLELLFSSNPFVQKFSGQFSHIRANQTQRIPLPADRSNHAFEVPTEFHNRNLLVEIVAGGITRSQAYFSNSLTVQVSDNYGQLKVLDTASGKPIPKTYVKVYAEMQDGRTLFYKDGYTDLRGRFDYSSLSTNELDFVKRFSLLVLDESRGGLVREAQIPKR